MIDDNDIPKKWQNSINGKEAFLMDSQIKNIFFKLYHKQIIDLSNCNFLPFLCRPRGLANEKGGKKRERKEIKSTMTIQTKEQSTNHRNRKQ